MKKFNSPWSGKLRKSVALVIFGVTSFLLVDSAKAAIYLSDDFDNVDNLTWVNAGGSQIADNLGALNYGNQGNFLTAIDLQAGNKYVASLEVSLNSVGGNPYLSFGFMDSDLTGASGRHNNNSQAYIQFNPEVLVVSSKSTNAINTSNTTDVAFATAYLYSLEVTTDALGTGATIGYSWTNLGTTATYSLGSQVVTDYTTANFDSIGVSGDFRGTTGNGTIDNFLVTITAVPEPSSLGLLAMAGLGFCARRTRKN